MRDLVNDNFLSDLVNIVEVQMKLQNNPNKKKKLEKTSNQKQWQKTKLKTKRKTRFDLIFVTIETYMKLQKTLAKNNDEKQREMEIWPHLLYCRSSNEVAKPLTKNNS